MRSSLRPATPESEQRTRLFRLLTILLIVGIGIGSAISYALGEAPCHSIFLDHGFAEHAGTRTLLSVLRGSFRPTAILLLLDLLLGFSAIGQPFAVLILLDRGMALGIATAATYFTYGMRGLPVVLLLQFPHAAATSVLLLLAARESMRFSRQLTEFLLRDGDLPGLRGQLKLYFIKYLVLLLLLLICAAGDCALTYCLSDFLHM